MNNCKRRIMMRNAKRNEMIKQTEKKTCVNKILVKKCERSAKVIEFRNDISVRRREETNSDEFNLSIEETYNNRKNRIMIRNAKRIQIRKQAIKKSRENRILVIKAMRSAKVVEFRNDNLERRREVIDSSTCYNTLVDNFRILKTKNNREHRFIIRNAKRNEIRKEISESCISRIEAIRKIQAIRKARRSERVIKINGKRKRNCTTSEIC